MKLDMNFKENDRTFDLQVDGESQGLDVSFDEITVVYNGDNGATFYPSVSDDGVLSWTNDRELENPQPVSLKGEPGYTPIKGKDYFDGKDGYTPKKGVDYFDGEAGYTPVKGIDYDDGKDGYSPIKGIDYFDGEDGHTPVKGVDYYTEADKTEMVTAVLSALPVYNGEVVTV